jgi:Alg9-like mannosyltransferase family
MSDLSAPLFTDCASVSQFKLPPILAPFFLPTPALSFSNAIMSHSSPVSSKKSRAAPLKIKRRATPPSEAQTQIQDKRIFLALVCVRIFNALTIRTFFQPDEYYQALEPAWKLVFGYGEVTWEWTEAIRSFVFPGLFALIWSAAKALGIQDANTLVCFLFARLMTRLCYQSF